MSEPVALCTISYESYVHVVGGRHATNHYSELVYLKAIPAEMRPTRHQDFRERYRSSSTSLAARWSEWLTIITRYAKEAGALARVL
jgi:hypothetical protein